MSKKILVLNAGSSSIKFQLYSIDLQVLAKGLCQRIFIDGNFEMSVSASGQKIEKDVPMPDHASALQCILDHLKETKVINDFNEIVGAGHRVVQGGDYFKDSALIGQVELDKIIEFSKLAPLHNIHEANVIKILMNLIPECKNVAVFDTTFHATMPAENYKYAIPQEWESKHLVRRYGMHGTSYHYITEKMQEHLKKPSVNLIICHLGNGASICVVKDSKSYNTSMGFTPLEGLIMGTRSGDIDPSVVEYMCLQTKADPSAIVNDLNKKSGLQALTGFSDMRDIFKDLDKNAVAVNMYTQRVANYIVSYLNQIGGSMDALVFTAGVGENSTGIVKQILDKLPLLQVDYDLAKLDDHSYSDVKQINGDNSKFSIYQVRTNEELMIVKNVLRFL